VREWRGCVRDKSWFYFFFLVDLFVLYIAFAKFCSIFLIIKK